MNKKQISILLLTMFLLPLALVPVGEAETRWVWGFLYEGMDLDIYAPYQGYAGQIITIRVRVEAKEDIHDIFIKISLYASKSAGYADGLRISMPFIMSICPLVSSETTISI